VTANHPTDERSSSYLSRFDPGTLPSYDRTADWAEGSLRTGMIWKGAISVAVAHTLAVRPDAEVSCRIDPYRMQRQDEAVKKFRREQPLSV
jgi:hypothetical protein